MTNSYIDATIADFPASSGPLIQTNLITPTVEAFAASRGISRQTLEKLDVVSGLVRFEKGRDKVEALVFRYPNGDWKARSASRDTKHFKAKPKGNYGFFNLERVLASPSDTVWVVEGEMDVLAMVEAGVPIDEVLATQGSPNAKEDDEAPTEKTAKKYAYVDEALRAGLAKKRRVIFAGDNDPPGRALRRDLVFLFGKPFSNFLEWPEGFKDAGEVLEKAGVEMLAECLARDVRAWPTPGLKRISDFPTPLAFEAWTVGPLEWGDRVKLGTGKVSVFTGYPGHGKTSMAIQFWAEVALRYDVVVAILSFETPVKPELHKFLREFFLRVSENIATSEMLREADIWIENHFIWFDPDGDGGKPTPSWLFEQAEIAIIRHGARAVMVDPFNGLESEHNPRSERYDQYVGNILKRSRSFARDYNIHWMWIAHPTKVDVSLRNKAPGLQDIAETRMWDTVVDQGFSIFRAQFYEGGEQKTEADFHYLKARGTKKLGSPRMFKVKFDPETERFSSADPWPAAPNSRPLTPEAGS